MLLIATIENCPSSTSTLLLPESSDTVNLTIDNVIFASMYGKSCSGQKLNLQFPETTLKWEKTVQTVTVTAADTHGSASCSLSVLIAGKPYMRDFCNFIQILPPHICKM